MNTKSLIVACLIVGSSAFGMEEQVKEKIFEESLPEQVQWRPSEYPGVTWLTTMLFVEDVPEAAKFYEEVFGMKNIFDKVTSEDGVIQEEAPVFIRLRFRGSNICIFKKGVQFFPKEVVPGKEATQSMLIWMYLDDSDDDGKTNAVDALFKKAINNKCECIREPKDEFWGDRVAHIKDPYGYIWALGKKI